MRPSFIRLALVFSFLGSFFTTYSQIALYGVVYIAAKNELHIAHPVNFILSSGKSLLTEEPSQKPSLLAITVSGKSPITIPI